MPSLPAGPWALLPLIVVVVMVSDPLPVSMPPPWTAELPETVVPVNVAVPSVVDAAAENGRRVAADRAVGERHVTER